MRGKLTLRQSQFVNEYLVDLNATKAAVRAGYSEKTAHAIGHELLEKTLVRQAIAEARSKMSERTQLNADWVLKRLEKIVERCMQAEPVLDHEGNPTGEYRFDSRGANTALTTIANHLGMLKNKLEVTGKDGAPLQFMDLTEEQRVERILVLFQRAREKLGAIPDSGRNTEAIGRDVS